jgi:hypothetical protein
LAAQWRADTRFPGEEKPPCAAGSNTGGIFLGASQLSGRANELLTENPYYKPTYNDGAQRIGSMDNILKLIVGCLGLVGLIVMIVPNSDPLASTKDGADETTTTAAPPIGESGAPPPPPAEPVPAPASQDDQSEFVVDDFDINNFGKPMVDPTPPGQRAPIAQQPQNGPNSNNQGNFGGTLNGGTELSTPAGPTPAPLVPVN